MKKLFFILFIVLCATVAMMTDVRADSVAAHLIGTDGLNPSYGLSYTIENSAFYTTFEDSTNQGFLINSSTISAGLKIGPINLGPAAGVQIQQANGTATGMLGAELGFSAPLVGPIFVQENNRVLRGAGGISNSQVDVGLGVRL